MKTKLIVHGAWAAAAIAAFALGSRMFPAGPHASDTSGVRASRPASKHPRPPAWERGGSGEISQKRTGHNRTTGDRPADAVLSEADIASLGETLRTSSNPIERRLAFSRMLEALTAENALIMREQIADMPADSPEFREFHYAWGAVAGATAVLFGAETAKSDMAPAIAGWAGADPSAAVDWFQNLDMQSNPAISKLLAENNTSPEDLQDLRKHLAAGMVHGLSDADPFAASDFVLGLSANSDGKADWMMGIVTDKMLHANGPDEAASWAQDLPEGTMRAGALDKVARHYANRDPAAAVAWLESIPATGDTSRGLRAAFSTWAHKDPEPAGAYIDQMAPSKERDMAISGYAPSITYKDPAAAIELADTIDDPAVREQVLIRSSQIYYHRVDKEAAAAWLPNSGLSPEAQQQVIHPPRRR